ncbi:MAG: cytochrome c oxidase assembly protein [Gammaproteobacteria bacterium]|nr:MAG: cytochrome c oxidase assembly protein [Gammaproteobacteria bacterium]
MTDSRDRQRKHTALLLLVAVGMFGFAFALVPLYNVFCELTGINGKTSGQAAVSVQTSPILEREVTIQFLAHVGRGMPWEFRPMESRLRVRLGEVNETRFYVRNHANQAVTGQAVPSVAPGLAARYLHKIECFCFTQQTLEAGEEMEMLVKFYMGVDLPADINTLSLSYALFPVTVAQTTGLEIDRDSSDITSAAHEEHSGS